MPTLLTSWYGSFVVDDRGAVREKRLFPRGEIHARLRALDRGEVVPEERELASDGSVTVVEKRLLQLPGAEMARERALDAARAIERRLVADAPREGFDAAALHAAALSLSQAKVRDSSATRDMHVVQAVDAIDELSNEANVVMERLREWYGLHYPELLSEVPRNEDLAAIVSEHGNRDAIRAAKPEFAKLESPMGAEIQGADEAALRGLARSAATMYATRAELEKYLDAEMPGIAPNLTQVTGAVLAARLLKHAGSLRRLATMPAGTIQTLGAEKALFRHIKEGKKPPKHGVIFQHPLLHRAPRHQRGALARALAGKITLAARADYFTKASLGEGLAKEFEARADVIRVEHAKPSKRVGRPDVRERKADRGRPRDTRYDRGSGDRRGGGFQPRGPPQGEGGFRPRGPPRDDRPRGPPREEGFRPRAEGEGFRPRGPPREEGFRPRGPPQGEGGFRPRGPPREDRRDDRGAPPSGGFRPRGPPPGPPGKGGGYDFGRPPTRRDFERGPPRKGKGGYRGKGGDR